jgi:hypothetical protein
MRCSSAPQAIRTEKPGGLNVPQRAHQICAVTMDDVLLMLVTLPILVILGLGVYARVSNREHVVAAIDVSELLRTAEVERMKLLTDALLDQLITIQSVAEGSVLYRTAVTRCTEVETMDEIRSLSIDVSDLVRFYTPQLASQHARVERQRKVEDLAALWRGKLRTSEPEHAQGTAQRSDLRSTFFGE